MIKYQIKKNQRGVSLYLALMIMVILLALVLGLSTIFLSQVKMIKEMENSVVAFYAADTGIEEVLVNRMSNPQNTSGSLEGSGATYNVEVYPRGVDCSANNYCIKSVGTYKKTKRAIEVRY